VAEGVVNLVTSIALARHMGALGVALGTLLGAVAGVAVHFGVSMRYTQSSLAVRRLDLLANGMLRSLAIAVPSVLLLWRWWPVEGSSMTAYLYCGWLLSTLLLAWFVSMGREDRVFIAGMIGQKMSSL
jgi:O-antigen/teichoic acid export membrane protein